MGRANLETVPFGFPFKKKRKKKESFLRGFFFFSLAKCLSSIQLPHYYNASRNKTPILRAATTISPFTNVRNVPGSFCSGATDPPPRQRKGDDSFFLSPLLSATAQRSGWMRGRRTTKWAKKKGKTTKTCTRHSRELNSAEPECVRVSVFFKLRAASNCNWRICKIAATNCI